MEPRDRLVWARLHLGKYRTASDAARAIGVAIPTYSGHENGSRGLTQPAIDRYAKFFRVPPEWIQYGRGEPRAGVPGPSEQEEPGATPEPIAFAVQARPNASAPMPLRSGSGQLPILGRAAGGPNGKFIFNGERVGSVAMPAQLEGVPDAYGVYVHGESMVPRYEPGEILHVNPHKPVKKGDYIVAQIAEAEGESPSGFVKKLVSRSDRELVLLQLNPPDDEDELMRFPGNRVVSVHKIVGTGEGQ